MSFIYSSILTCGIRPPGILRPETSGIELNQPRLSESKGFLGPLEGPPKEKQRGDPRWLKDIMEESE